MKLSNKTKKHIAEKGSDKHLHNLIANHQPLDSQTQVACCAGGSGDSVKTAMINMRNLHPHAADVISYTGNNDHRMGLLKLHGKKLDDGVKCRLARVGNDHVRNELATNHKIDDMTAWTIADKGSHHNISTLLKRKDSHKFSYATKLRISERGTDAHKAHLQSQGFGDLSADYQNKVPGVARGSVLNKHRKALKKINI